MLYVVEDCIRDVIEAVLREYEHQLCFTAVEIISRLEVIPSGRYGAHG